MKGGGFTAMVSSPVWQNERKDEYRVVAAKPHRAEIHHLGTEPNPELLIVAIYESAVPQNPIHWENKRHALSNH